MPRALWKGRLVVDLLTCPVALQSAVSTAEAVDLDILNRATGNRVRREWVDEATGDVVPSAEAVRGRDIGEGEHVVLEPEEIQAIVPVSDKTLAVERFVPLADVDEAYFDRPYFLAPDGRPAVEAYGVIREALARTGTAALARAVLFRRDRWVAVMARGDGLVAHTLHPVGEVRAADEAFREVPAFDIPDEMLALARHIIETRAGPFEADKVADRYREALVDLIRAKQAGRAPKPVETKKPSNVVDLMEALRRSAGASAAEAEPPAAKPRRAKADRRPSGRRPPAARKAG